MTAPFFGQVTVLTSLGTHGLPPLDCGARRLMDRLRPRPGREGAEHLDVQAPRDGGRIWSGHPALGLGWSVKPDVSI